GELSGSDRVLHDAVEPAAVHRPELARDAWLPPVGWRRGEPAVQPVEVERRPDPGDPGDHVGPAEREIEPLLEVGAHTGSSAAAVRRVAERADEQRHVILLGIANLEYDLDEPMEWRDAQGREVRPRVEAQPVRTGGSLDVAREQIRDAPVGVAPASGELRPTVARAARQRDGDARGGPPARDVQDVGRDAAHETTSLSSRSRVIFACSAPRRAAPWRDRSRGDRAARRASRRRSCPWRRSGTRARTAP